MKILHYDCFAGISGDMNLAALVDLGVPVKKLCAELELLGLERWKIKTSRDSRGGVFGTRLDVVLKPQHDSPHGGGHSHGHCVHFHRAYADIVGLVEKSGLSDFVKTTSLKIFKKLAEAEARIHRKKIGEVCFHEVGAADSIIDIVGAAVCLEILGVEKIVSTPVELGGGTVVCAHGILPVPAPATALLSKNFAFTLGGAPHECTTPTGAAIIAALAEDSDGFLKGKTIGLVGCGVGIGHRDSPELPNFLRVSLFELAEKFKKESSHQKNSDKFFSEEIVFEYAANIDDMCAEEVSYLCGKLFESGALDVWSEAVCGKKNRLATKVCALSRGDCKSAVLNCFFENSSTLGVRFSQKSRAFLPRCERLVKTKSGNVRVKFSRFGSGVRAKAEFDDVAEYARKNKISFARAAREIAEEF